jgi:viroplasmin and RNaseH domain-containing protein
VYKAFVTLEDAQEYMKEREVTEPKEVIKVGAGETTPLRGSQAFYAVAHGRKPDIYPYW